MNLCIPVETDLGLDSKVYGHFGSAPLFLIIDTETMTTKAITNNNQNHAHGMCQPVKAVEGEAVDGIVVSGIGRGALMKFNAAGYQVFRSTMPAVKETIEAYKSGTLPLCSVQDVCGGHGQGGGCSH
jgi:predicted Fe-Mo cluster-binding NifX family protein